MPKVKSSHPNRYPIGEYWKGQKQPFHVRKKNSDSVILAYKEGRHKKVWKGKHHSKEHRGKIKQSNIETWKCPKLRKKIDKIMTAWWKAHPHIRKARSEKMKRYYIENPDMFKKFMQGGKNSSKLTRKTKAGYFVRSIGEKKIADFLHDNKIPHSYESHTLLLDGWLCTPDFYIHKYNCLVEYYGGHPKAEKKKRIKNKLYKKYKIPCVFVTPSELRNLPKYLVKDAEKNRARSARWKKFVLK